MFRPVNLNRAGTKKKRKKEAKNHQFLLSQPFTTTLLVTSMSLATSILSITVSPPASASSSSPFHFYILCFSSTFPLLCSLVILVLNIGKFLDTPGVRRNGTPFSHIYNGPHHEFNEWTPP